MPKKIPLAEKREWLELYEQGKSEAAIAKGKHRDLNVIKRGMEEARNERNLSMAKSAMLKDALRQHQDKLLEVTNSILGALVMPSAELELPRQLGNKAQPIKLTVAHIEYDPDVGLIIKIDGEGNVQWELIREHLRRDRLWSKLEKWKKVMLDHIKARTDLRLKAQTLLKESTGLRVLDTIDNASGDDYLYFAGVNLFYQIALTEAVEAPNIESFREELVVISEPCIKYERGNVPLAHCSKSHHAACRSKIIEAFQKLKRSSEIGRIKATYEELDDITTKARKLAEEISLLGLVPGQCRVCRRLGI